MADAYTFTPVAHIENAFDTCFGIPRQGGLSEITSRVVFEKAFRSPEAVRALEGFSHLWLLWVFTESAGWRPTVRPPKLGGNTRVGVFASRSPYRPNPIGLSAVRLLRVEEDQTLVVTGADLMNGTPILDIKPYLPYCDAIPGAEGGFAPPPEAIRLPVEDPDGVLAALPPAEAKVIREVLSQDPRPGYARDEERVYGAAIGGKDVRFRVTGGRVWVVEALPRTER